MKGLYKASLQEAYSAEAQLTTALPRILDAAASPDLKRVIELHVQVTEHQLERVEDLLQDMGSRPGATVCKAMRCLIQACIDVAAQHGDPYLRDAALIAALRKIEHYEIAAYSSLCNWARSLGDEESTQILQLSLDEVYEADDSLTALTEFDFYIEA